MKIDVKIKLTRGAQAPEYATDGSAAVDIRAALEGGEVIINPGERAMIPTGIAISTGRDDVVAIMAGRSGLGAKHGITLANGIGVIDSDYRGELRATLINNGKEPFKVSDGDRIAQLMFMPVIQASFIEADELDETERGTGGFGSTGVN
ncbi:MAG: dUTP diphosphatase [Clostridia bacterium]|nr:dUTP diphosphatase [Clostridia bacterium]